MTDNELAPGLPEQCETVAKLLKDAANQIRRVETERDAARESHAMQQRNTEAFFRENTRLRAELAVAKARVGTVLREAWHVARDGCLVPPDGGSPTEDEVALCNHIADGIQTLIDREGRAAAKAGLDEKDSTP